MKTTAIYFLAMVASLAMGATFFACEDDDTRDFEGSDGDADGDGDGDSDGDADIPWDPEADCDCPDVASMTADGYGAAMNICPGTDTINSISAFSSSPNGDLGMEAIDKQGNNNCLLPQHGCQMFALSTGPVGQADPNSAESMGGVGDEYPDPIPQYQGSSISGGGGVETICDVNQLRVNLTAPTGAEGFSFDFLFASAEYDEWLDQGFNDTFYAILEHDNVNGGATTNISFDSNNSEIEVDVNFFENSMFPCDETGSGWEPAMPGVSGSTGWLRTSYPVQGGDTFSLTFSIHDEGDCIYDSIVFLDNFQWSGDPVVNETVPIE